MRMFIIDDMLSLHVFYQLFECFIEFLESL
jgi:hypothetical protein